MIPVALSLKRRLFSTMLLVNNKSFGDRWELEVLKKTLDAWFVSKKQPCITIPSILLAASEMGVTFVK